MGRSFSRLCAIFLSSTALIGTAYAADLPEPVMPAGDWTGFHVGFGGGYGGVNHRLAVDVETPGPDFDDALSLSGLGGEGALVTVEGGYDFQVSNFVFGIQGDWTHSSIGTDLDFFNGAFGFTLEAANSFTGLGRLGWLSNPDTLIYGLVGWTWTEFEGDFSGGGPNYNFDLDGLTVGAGIETRFTPNITGKLEYRYVDYGDNTLAEGPIGPAFVELYNDSSLQTIRAVISYRFGNPGGYVTPTADFEPATIANWTGLRVGVGGGYGHVNHELELDIAGFEVANLSGFSGEGGLFTAEIGYDHQFSEKAVVGIQFDYTGSDIETVAELDLDVDGFTGYRLKARDNFTVAGRLGYLANPDTLVYGLVGWTWTNFEQDIEFVGNPVFSNDFDADGLTLGAGIETVLADNFTGKLEYRYTHYDPVNVFEFDVPLNDIVLDGELNNHISLQSIRAVVSYKLPVLN
ncbi:MAG: outer membrane beta-barrel protein [Anderseniella sp.]|nr:outer membrane beta-barrel protein [Anderseniella sp.]